jgi:hypothetical protein
MSHTIQVPDEVYEAIAAYAQKHGQTPEEAISAWAADVRQHEAPPARPTERHYSARELMRLPLEERNRILAAAADVAAEEYATNPDLADFEAAGEDDLYDDYPE